MIDDPLNKLKVKRGSDLPQARLNEEDVSFILQLIREREDLKARAKELTNTKIAEKFGVHFRTIDRISAGESWTHVD